MSATDMTTAEQSIADDKMRAEIANLNAMTARLNTEVSKLIAETGHIKVQMIVAPFLAAAGVIGATAAAVKLFF